MKCDWRACERCERARWRGFYTFAFQDAKGGKEGAKGKNAKGKGGKEKKAKGRNKKKGAAKGKGKKAKKK